MKDTRNIFVKNLRKFVIVSLNPEPLKSSKVIYTEFISRLIIQPIQHGEGPFWDDEEQALYFADTFKATVYRWEFGKCEVTQQKLSKILLMNFLLQGCLFAELFYVI